MPHIVLESCIRCKFTDCVDVCPVDCFREGPNMEVTSSPVPASDIRPARSRSPGSRVRLEVPTPAGPADPRDACPVSTKPQLPDSDQWKDVKDKLQYLQK